MGVATLAVGLFLFFASHVEPSGLDVLEEFATESDSSLPRDKEFTGLSIVLICLGTLVSFVSFLGCFGACIKGRCLLATVRNIKLKVIINNGWCTFTVAQYVICVGLILTLQLLVSIFAIVYRQPMTRTLKEELLQHIKHEYRPDTDMDRTWALAHQTVRERITCPAQPARVLNFL